MSARRRRSGMSLPEVMVSIVIILVMMGLALQAIDHALELRNLLEQRDETTRAARVALGRLRREFQLAFLTAHRDAIEQYETVFVGRDDDPDAVWMATRSHQRLYRDSRESDQTEITVWAEPARGEDERGYVLWHREAPRIDEEPHEGGLSTPLAHNVRSFELRFLDARSDEWKTEWDSRSADTPNLLPRAVTIGLVLIGPDPMDPERTVDLSFLTTVVLEYGQGFGRSLAFAPVAASPPAAQPPRAGPRQGGRGAGGGRDVPRGGVGGGTTLPGGVRIPPAGGER